MTGMASNQFTTYQHIISSSTNMGHI